MAQAGIPASGCGLIALWAAEIHKTEDAVLCHEEVHFLS
ncbi:hypothetical protein NBRC3257_2427 [Gluconobacter thailandicus NBRC 3257]|uniref:Uncharacterized protein n=1 Tax=Gluconobacter thailandicus NBRC 3257 TaxID=1381097 RepID=A0ABQ0IZ15_GLUTH|nr:hypothetical protein B932_3488 [Gluconobacter oxydans H24]GAC87051.1 hypothetical protein NBRC3255_0712 [Gluconobacter thailandicus NBRC 3255]GAD27428.1 hypothetical protein NBRC3257_2427 [Gluconobacter thailandicus NBRC 3257]